MRRWCGAFAVLLVALGLPSPAAAAPGPSGCKSGVWVEYFASREPHRDHLKHSGCDSLKGSTLHKGPWDGSPLASKGMPSDNFSIRWNILWDFADAIYQFNAFGDDAVEVSVDGRRVLGDLSRSAESVMVQREWTTLRKMTKGTHRVLITLSERDGSATSRLDAWWRKTCKQGELWTEYFPEFNHRSNVEELFGSRSGTGCTKGDWRTAIEEDWGSDKPAKVEGDGEGWGVRWMGFVTADRPGPWTVNSNSDDGLVVRIGAHRPVAAWHERAGGAQRATIELGAGVYLLRVEFFERTGAAFIDVDFTPPPATRLTKPSHPRNGYSRKTELSFILSSDQEPNFSCALIRIPKRDSRPAFRTSDWQPCQTDYSATVTEGFWAFSAAARNRFDVYDPDPPVHRFTVDRTAPRLTGTTTSPRNGATVVPHGFTFEVSFDEPVKITCSTKRAKARRCGSGWAKSHSGSGRAEHGKNSLQITARDQAGNPIVLPPTNWTVAAPINCDGGTYEDDQGNIRHHPDRHCH